MKALLALVPVTIFALASCGTNETQSGSPTPSYGGDMTESGSGPAKSCQSTCTKASDCAIPGEPLQDAAHYACTSGKCVWQGCASTAECSTALSVSNVTCTKPAGAPVSTCVETCNAAADCAVAGSPLSDASHFACTAGTCVWQGCKSTSDCATALHSSKYVCGKPTGSSISTCLPTCTAAADCAIPGTGSLNDASHYACKSGQCQWLGCKSTSDCTTNLHSSAYVCQ